MNGQLQIAIRKEAKKKKIQIGLFIFYFFRSSNIYFDESMTTFFNFSFRLIVFLNTGLFISLWLNIVTEFSKKKKKNNENDFIN